VFVALQQSRTVLSLFEDDKRQLWVGTVSGLNKFNSQTEQFTRYTSNDYPIGSNVIFDICQDEEGTIWFGSYSGLNKINEDRKEYANIKNVDSDPHSLSDNQIRSLFINRDNLLWVGAYNGLSSYDFSTSVFNRIKHTPNDPKSLSAKYVWSVLKDSKGNIWVGTKEGGLDLLDSTFQKVKNYQHNANQPSSISSNDILSLYEDEKKQLWVGTDDKGLNLFQSEEDQFTNRNYQPNDLIASVGSFVKSIAEDDKGNYWVGTVRSGLNYYNPRTKRFKNFRHIPDDSTSLNNNRVYDILQDSKGRLWLATNDGLNLFHYETETFSQYVHVAGDPNTLSNNSVYSITEDSKGRLWLGTRDGLNLFNPEEGRFKVYNKASGLPDNTIYVALEDDDNNLWLSTNKGICRFNPEKNTVISYDKEDGLQSNQFNTGSYFKDAQGRFYFGGVNGINIFHPDSMKSNTVLPKVAITDLLLFNKSVPMSDSTVLNQSLDYTKSITLHYDDYIFAFEFSALNFRQPSKNQYEYRLYPFDKEWITTDSRDRKAVYTRVPHGTYQFQVRASNDDGYWNKTGKSIEVIILPPWWLTWWMKAIYWGLGIGIPLSIYFGRVNALKKRQKVLEEEVKVRTAEVSRQNETLIDQKARIEAQAEELHAQNTQLIELDDFKQNMMGMIVHDLKNPLNGIIHASEANPANGIKRLKKSGQQMLNMVLNILDVYKYENSAMKVDLVEQPLGDLVQEAIGEVHFLAENKNISLGLKLHEFLKVQAEREVIVRVLVNLLTNAIKYTPQNGEVTISSSIDEKLNRAIVSVKDSGQGISPENIELIFQRFGQAEAKKSGEIRSTGIGLTFCKLAVEAHQGEIGVDSELGKGSVFWFSLLLGEQNQGKVPQGQNTATLVSDEKSFVLSDSKKEALKPYMERLKTLMVYEATDIENVLTEITNNDNEITIWKEKVKAAVFNMNEVQYQTLLKV
ncbi:MAG: two-component regulator propeller domain-containing protein, partial [Bacteroidota bacterium]